MIHVNRDRVKPPATLKSDRARKALIALTGFFQQPANERRQLQPPFDHSIWMAKDVIAALTTLFHSKCAYCESRVGGTARYEVEMFRPKWQAMTREGGTHFDGYWWLAFEPSNFRFSCLHCNERRRDQETNAVGGKGSAFPLLPRPDETRRGCAACGG